MECYLCGAENSTDADYCYRCDGQLLKVSPDSEEETELILGVEEELIDDEVESPRFRRPRMRSLRSAEHRRLEDALGLNDDDDGDGPYGTVVPTVEPTATPMIGTRAGHFDVSRLETADINRRTLAFLSILALLVGFFGYRVLTHEPNTALPPDELPFTNPTLPSIPETTVTTIRPWSQNELIGKFAPTFMTVLLYECSGAAESDEGWTSRYVTAGIAIDERNVIFSSEGFPNFDAVVILSGLGNSAIAYPNTHESGAEVASTIRSFSRTLDLVDEPNGEETFLISRDIASATTAVATAQDLGNDLFADSGSSETAESEDDDNGPENTQVASGTIGVGATTLGDAVAVFIGESRYELDDLRDMGRFRAELIEDAVIGGKSVPCTHADLIVDATPEPEPEEVDEPTVDDSEAAESVEPNG